LLAKKRECARLLFQPSLYGWAVSNLLKKEEEMGLLGHLFAQKNKLGWA